MKPPEYMLFRLNIENRIDLFSTPITSNEELTAVVYEATSERNDFHRKKGRSTWRWSLRAPVSGEITDLGRDYVVATFSHETISRPARHVSDKGVSVGVTAFNPPEAIPATVIFDLSRHIVAIEEVPGIVQTKPGWKRALETILGSAARWQRRTSVMHLEALPPRAVIERRLSNFKRVTRIQTTLRLPNPDLTDLYRGLFNDLKEGNVNEVTEDMRSEKGLNLSDGTLPRAVLEMAFNGYRKGKVRVFGSDQNDRPDSFVVADDVARVEGLRQYVEGIGTGSRTAEAKKVAADIIRKIDQLFPRGGNGESAVQSDSNIRT